MGRGSRVERAAAVGLGCAGAPIDDVRSAACRRSHAGDAGSRLVGVGARRALDVAVRARAGAFGAAWGAAGGGRGGAGGGGGGGGDGRGGGPQGDKADAGGRRAGGVLGGGGGGVAAHWGGGRRGGRRGAR